MESRPSISVAYYGNLWRQLNFRCATTGKVSGFFRISSLETSYGLAIGTAKLTRGRCFRSLIRELVGLWELPLFESFSFSIIDVDF